MNDGTQSRPRIIVDADACPVKDEIYRVAARYGLEVLVVTNSYLRLPRDESIRLVVVGDGFDAADDWIVAQAEAGDIVVTSDIVLARRCIGAGAAVLGSTGRAFTEASIGNAVADRGLNEHLRAIGERTAGPRPFAAADRSRFLSALDEAVNRARRRG